MQVPLITSQEPPIYKEAQDLLSKIIKMSYYYSSPVSASYATGAALGLGLGASAAVLTNTTNTKHYASATTISVATGYVAAASGTSASSIS